MQGHENLHSANSRTWSDPPTSVVLQRGTSRGFPTHGKVEEHRELDQSETLDHLCCGTERGFCSVGSQGLAPAPKVPTQTVMSISDKMWTGRLVSPAAWSTKCCRSTSLRTWAECLHIQISIISERSGLLRDDSVDGVAQVAATTSGVD